MPELPEVETVKRGLQNLLVDQTIIQVDIRQLQLRWPISTTLSQVLPKQRVKRVDRRGKYLLIYLSKGVLIVHLGMSGKLRVLSEQISAQKHDHVDIIFKSGLCLRFTDPRRFGAILYVIENPFAHPCLKNLGIEPLSTDFNQEILFQESHRRKISIKQLIMDSNFVVGIGNIYANEALFLAGILPSLPANQLNKIRCQKLINAIRTVLQKAIEAGGTTLKDFLTSEGNPGYFQQQLKVYGREGEPCFNCHRPIQKIVISGRSTYYCNFCQN